MKVDSYSGHLPGSERHFGFKALRCLLSPIEADHFPYDISIIKRFMFLTAVVAWLASGLWQGRCEDSQPIRPARKASSVDKRRGYEVVDENGMALSLFSDAAYRAEFRFLQREFHKTDLAGSAAQPDTGFFHNGRRNRARHNGRFQFNSRCTMFHDWRFKGVLQEAN